MQIDQEVKRTMAIQYLSGAEKEAILREKYLATMKPVSEQACYLNTFSNFSINLISAHICTLFLSCYGCWSTLRQ